MAVKQSQFKYFRLAVASAFLLIAALVFYFIFRPIPPAEIPELKGYNQTLTVNLNPSILNGVLPTEQANSIVKILNSNRFRSLSESSTLPEADLTLFFADNKQISFSKDKNYTYAFVQSGETHSAYRLSGQVYTNLTTIIYEAFPGGVQPLETEKWWNTYLAAATPALLEADFNSPKEIPFEVIVNYTYTQMVADSSAKEFQNAAKGEDVIPYDQMLRRARVYFADGVTATIKQSAYYDATKNAFVFKSYPAEYYGNFPYSDWNTYSEATGNFRLKSVIRKNTGEIEATFEDYNALGFRDEGTLTKIHYVVLLPTSDNSYRFLSKRSELANPEEISVEGYFTGYSEFGGFTPDNFADLDFSYGQMVGENLLLQTVKYTKDSAVLNLYLISYDYGKLLSTHTITGPATTSFWDVKTNENTVLVKTNTHIYMLDENLDEISQTLLPLSLAPEMDAFGYDVTFDMEKLVYSDDVGIHLYNFRNREQTMLVPHPHGNAEEILGETSLASGAILQPDVIIELLRNPTFIMDETRVLVSHVNHETITSYSTINNLGANAYLVSLGITPEPGSVEYIDNDKLIISHYPENTAEAQTASQINHIIMYFGGGNYRKFSTKYDPNGGYTAISGDYLYYFEMYTDPQNSEEDHFYRLMRLNLLTLNSESMNIIIQNAAPDILACSAASQILFSYRSAAGSGFGITKN